MSLHLSMEYILATCYSMWMLTFISPYGTTSGIPQSYVKISTGRMMTISRFCISPDQHLGLVSISRPSFSGMGIPMLKIRRSRHRLIFNMGIPILVRWHLYSETAPRGSNTRVNLGWYPVDNALSIFPFRMKANMDLPIWMWRDYQWAKVLWYEYGKQISELLQPKWQCWCLLLIYDKGTIRDFLMNILMA